MFEFCFASRRRAGRAAGGALLGAALSATLLAVPASAAAHRVAIVPAPVSVGDLKVHAKTNGVDEPRNRGRVCVFYLDAFNLSSATEAKWMIHKQSALGAAPLLSGRLTLNKGRAWTIYYSLPTGLYRLDWTAGGAQGRKLFWSACAPAAVSNAKQVQPAAGTKHALPHPFRLTTR